MKKQKDDIVTLDSDVMQAKPIKNRILAMEVEGLKEEIVYQASEILDQYDKVDANAFTVMVMEIRKKYGFNLKGINQTFDFNQDVVDRFECLLDAYLSLCAKYKHSALKTEYYALCGICKDTISAWRNGDSQNVTPLASDFVQNIDNIFENVLLSKVVDENSIGSMFLLKCKYGYVEKQHAQTINIQRDFKPCMTITDIRGAVAQLETEIVDVDDLD